MLTRIVRGNQLKKKEKGKGRKRETSFRGHKELVAENRPSEADVASSPD